MGKKQELNSKVKSYRLNLDDEKTLIELKINVSDLIRDAIRKAVDQSKCPTCGHKIPKSKS